MSDKFAMFMITMVLFGSPMVMAMSLWGLVETTINTFKSETARKIDKWSAVVALLMLTTLTVVTWTAYYQMFEYDISPFVMEVTNEL